MWKFIVFEGLPGKGIGPANSRPFRYWIGWSLSGSTAYGMGRHGSLPERIEHHWVWSQFSLDMFDCEIPLRMFSAKAAKSEP